MNAQIQIAPPRPVRLRVDQFWHLKRAGAFSAFGKSELLDGIISGVPLQGEDEPGTDASIPIKLRVQDYLLLDEAGLLAENGKTELIDGVLYQMSPQHRPHWYAKNELTYRLRRALEEVGSALYVGSEGSVVLSDLDLSEPDIVVTDAPLGAGPIPAASIRLLVEIADTTRRYDLGPKSRSYAQAGVPEYWVVDLQERVIHRMWAPAGDLYGSQTEIALGNTIGAATISGLSIETTGL